MGLHMHAYTDTLLVVNLPRAAFVVSHVRRQYQAVIARSLVMVVLAIALIFRRRLLKPNFRRGYCTQICGSFVGGAIFHMLHMPSFFGYVCAGVVMGPIGLNKIHVCKVFCLLLLSTPWTYLYCGVVVANKYGN